MQAAIDGRGVALGFVPLMADDFAAGRLVQPFGAAATDHAYFIVYPPAALARPKVRAFRDWLMAEVNS